MNTMTIRNLFVRQLNHIAGQTVEVGYDSVITTGVVDYARDDVLALVETSGRGTGSYAPVNTVLFVNVDSIDFVRLL